MNDKIYRLLNTCSPLLVHHKKALFSLRYYRNFHRKLQLKKPVLFHDKIFWLACNTDTSMWSKLADKYEVREYVASCYGDKILNKLLGVYDNPESIDYDALPQQFILKTTNGSATYIIVKDKACFDKEEAHKKLKYWLKFKYGDITGQPHYSKIPPRIIAESLLVQDNDPNKALIDYKFYCFNGQPYYCLTYSDRVLNTHIAHRMIYDMQWQAHPEFFDKKVKEANSSRLDCPRNFEQMIEIAGVLSKGFPFVRVDLYNIEDKPMFGEFTFTPELSTHFTYEFQKELGDKIILPQLI